jgi:mRNA-degrading endonuclease RelE of RelBE toxin-antitoxin system
LSAVRNSAEKRADNFCKEKNKARVTVSERHSNPPHILGNWPRIELLFVCTDKAQKTNSMSSQDDKYTKLSKIKKLYDDKVLTEKEFLIEKKKILKINSTYDRKLQEKIFNVIQNLPDGDVKKLLGNDIPPIYRIRVSKYTIL